MLATTGTASFVSSIGALIGIFSIVAVIAGGLWLGRITAKGNAPKELIDQLDKANHALQGQNEAQARQIESLEAGKIDSEKKVATLETRVAFLMEQVTQAADVKGLTVTVRALVERMDSHDQKLTAGLNRLNHGVDTLIGLMDGHVAEDRQAGARERGRGAND